jgi:hypothetical protein
MYYVRVERHQVIALLIYIIMVSLQYLRAGEDEAFKTAQLLLACLVPIFLYRVFAYFSGFGFPEIFAKDYGSENHAGPYAFFFWMVYIIACLFILF